MLSIHHLHRNRTENRFAIRTLRAANRNEGAGDDQQRESVLLCARPGRAVDVPKMNYGTTLGPRGWRGATLLAATLVLSGAAIYNGYPLVYPDTGDYVA